MKSAMFALQVEERTALLSLLCHLESPARGNALVAVEPQTRRVMISAGRIPKQN